MAVLEMEAVATAQAISAPTRVMSIQSNGASIEVERMGAQAGTSVLACVCSGGFLSTLGSPVYTMQLRGYAGSKVG